MYRSEVFQAYIACYRKFWDLNRAVFLTGELAKNHPAILRIVLMGWGLFLSLEKDLDWFLDPVEKVAVDVAKSSSSREEGQSSAGLDKL